MLIKNLLEEMRVSFFDRRYNLFFGDRVFLIGSHEQRNSQVVEDGDPTNIQYRNYSLFVE